MGCCNIKFGCLSQIGKICFASNARKYVYHIFFVVQRARASKNVKNFSQPADVLKIRKKQAAFFEANVLITDKPRSYPRARSVSLIVADRLHSIGAADHRRAMRTACKRKLELRKSVYSSEALISEGSSKERRQQLN